MSIENARETNRFYLAAWRWHFYAGVFVVPFLLILALSGLVMLLSTPLGAVWHRDLVRVTPVGARVTPEAQVAAVTAVHEGARVVTYVPPRTPEESAQVWIVPGHAGSGHADHAPAETRIVYVDPYRTQVLGSLNPLRTVYGWATQVHGKLLLGTFGDLLIEVAAGFGMLLIGTGLFLWWPRGGETAVLWARVSGRRRLGWRDLHSAVGFWTSGILAFFLLSGLAWTVVWGGKVVQGFSSLPPAAIEVEHVPQTHEALNHGSMKQVPWVLEQTPMPESGTLAGLPGIPPTMRVRLNTVVSYAYDNGFTGYRVNYPVDARGVWTVAAATMSRDIEDPRRDRVLHLDQYTGRVLEDYRFADYPLLGKAMAAGISVHQGNIGIANLILNVVFCLAVVALCVSGVTMWWMRRPAGVRRLVPPPMPKDVVAWRRAAAVMFVISLAFPLAALTLAAVALLDFAILSRVTALRMALK